MTQKRMIKFLQYVKQVNDAYCHDVVAIFSVERKEESFRLWFSAKFCDAKDSQFYIYTTHHRVRDEVRKNIYTRYDPNLERAERHILRLLKEAENRGQADEGEAVSG